MFAFLSEIGTLLVFWKKSQRNTTKNSPMSSALNVEFPRVYPTGELICFSKCSPTIVFYVMPWYAPFWKQVVERYMESNQITISSSTESLTLQECINILPNHLQQEIATLMEKEPQHVTLPPKQNHRTEVASTMPEDEIDLNVVEDE